MKKYFTYRESTISNGWVISPIYSEFFNEDLNKTVKGSFNLLACRISGLSWTEWLQYCKQNGATLYGKNSKYPVAVWKEQNKSFIDELNQRANILAGLVNFKELHL